MTGQKCSVPNLFSAISLTRPPTRSESIVPFSTAIFPHTPPLAFSLADHVEPSGVVGALADEEDAAGVVRLGGGGGAALLSMIFV